MVAIRSFSGLFNLILILPKLCFKCFLLIFPQQAAGDAEGKSRRGGKRRRKTMKLTENGGKANGYFGTS
jgi:hypothetical protein